MQLTLSDEEAQVMQRLLHDYLPQLRRQLAATDLPAREMRHELDMRVRLVERVLAELGKPSGSAASAAR
jgi:hypothetical protein